MPLFVMCEFILKNIKEVAPTQTYLGYLHFGSAFGFERVWAGTFTVFGPGLPPTRVGLHLVFVAMLITSLTAAGCIPSAWPVNDLCWKGVLK